MRILGIETSCDETAAAIVDDGRWIRSNVVASQIPIHERFGGVVPEIASRQHVLAIGGVVSRALGEANAEVRSIDAVAVTHGPGLAGPLLVGINLAKGFALGRLIPLIAVNHVEAHVLSVWLSTPRESRPLPSLPMAALVVSGGHTELILVREPGAYTVLGKTLDDAAGEAFDKVGRLLGLPYPGGPSVEMAANEAIDLNGFTLPRAWLPDSYDFSFSGLKTAVLRTVRDATNDSDNARLHPSTVSLIAHAFQESVADVLTVKLVRAVQAYGAKSAAIVGGVANNEYIRKTLAEHLDVPLMVPAHDLSSDNAAMVAGAAFWSQDARDYDLEVAPSLSLEDSSASQ